MTCSMAMRVFYLETMIRVLIMVFPRHLLNCDGDSTSPLLETCEMCALGIHFPIYIHIHIPSHTHLIDCGH